MADAKKVSGRKRSSRTSGSFQEDAGDGGFCEENATHTTDGGQSSSTTSRCSVRQLCAVIETFDEVKKQLVTEIEFDGLLDLPQINVINRVFSTSLLARVDCDKQCLTIDDQNKIPFLPQDVSRVFGIPCGPKDVLGNDAQISDKGISYLRECIGLHEDNPRSLKAVQDFLLTDIGMNPTTYQRDNFKTAFVVFAVSTLLAPATKHNYVSNSYWGAIRCTSEIPKFNWGAFLIKGLMESARKVQSDITNKRDVSSISGCHLFLQVLYLDNIWLPGLSTPHDVFPRIKSFGGDKLTSFVSTVTLGNSFAVHPLRDSTSVCYTWKDEMAAAPPKLAQGPHGMQQTPDADMATQWETPVFMTKDDIPSASAMYNMIGVSYPSLIWNYAKTFQQCQALQARLLTDNLVQAEILLDMLANGSHLQLRACSRTTKKGISFSSLNNKPIIGRKLQLNDFEVDTPGSNAQACPQPHPAIYIATKERDHLGVASDLHKKRKHSTPTCSQASSNHGQSLKQRGSYVSARSNSTKQAGQQPQTSGVSPGEVIIESMHDMVTELTIAAAEHGSSGKRILYGQCAKDPIEPRRIRKLPFEKPAWVLGGRHPHYNASTVDELFQWCRDYTQQFIRSTWLSHPSPRFIKLTGLDVKRQIVQSDQMTCDIVDLLIRRFKQYDNLMHANAFQKRWRHFFETDFATYALSGFTPLDIVHVRNQFDGEEVPYNLTTCRMFIVPAFIEDAWCCYFFDMMERTTIVIDPLMLHSPSSGRHDLNAHAAMIICNSLFKCLHTIYENFPISNDTWCIDFPQLDVCTSARADTGVAMLHCARNFTGEEMLDEFDEADIIKERKTLLADVLTLEGNMSYVPVSEIIGKLQ